jgi:peptide/nickel transport system permease protein
MKWEEPVIPMGVRKHTPADSKILILVLIFLGWMHAAVVWADRLAPYEYDQQYRDFSYAPPTRIHWDGGRLVVYGLEADAGGEYREDASRRYPLRFLFRGRLFGVEAPGRLFLLGTDGYGRDILSRVLYGGRISLLTGLLAAALAVGIGWMLGTAAGFFGGWLDEVVMRGSELFLALPWLYLLLAVRAFLPLHIGPVQAFLLLVAIIGGVGWVRPARLVRGVALSARERPFVLSARGFGAGPLHLLRRHIVPFTLPVALTQASVLIPQYILAEVTLSFLGLGVGEPVPSWGNMLAEARHFDALTAHPWLLAPGLAAIPALLAYLILSDTVTINVTKQKY